MKKNLRIIACRALFIVGIASVAFGCASTVPQQEQVLSKSIRQAAGIVSAIEFRQEQEPVDVSDAQTGVLTLDEFVRRSLDHSPEVQAAFARVRAAQADAKQSRLLPNPIVSVIFRWPEGGGSPTIEAGLVADLVSLLSRSGRISAADSRLRAASAEALTQVLDVINDAQQRYVAAQSLGGGVAVLEQRRQIVERLLQLARDRLNLGEGTQLDVLTLQTQQTELETELSDRKLELREQRLALARLLGQPSGNLDWQLSAWEPYRGAFVPESQWIALGLDQRPEVLAKRYELAALGAELQQTQWSPLEGTEIGVDSERDGGVWSVGPAVSLPIPIFDFGQARRERARAAQIAARHELTQIQRQVVEQTRQAYAAFEITRENLVRVRGELIPLLQKRLEQAELEFKTGRDITPLLLAEVEMRAGQTRLVELERRNTEAIIRLQRATGGPGLMPTTAPTTQSVK